MGQVGKNPSYDAIAFFLDETYSQQSPYYLVDQKVHSDFSARCYRKTRTKLLASPTYDQAERAVITIPIL